MGEIHNDVISDKELSPGTSSSSSLQTLKHVRCQKYGDKYKHKKRNRYEKYNKEMQVRNMISVIDSSSSSQSRLVKDESWLRKIIRSEVKKVA